MLIAESIAPIAAIVNAGTNAAAIIARLMPPSASILICGKPLGISPITATSKFNSVDMIVNTSKTTKVLGIFCGYFGKGINTPNRSKSQK